MNGDDDWVRGWLVERVREFGDRAKTAGPRQRKDLRKAVTAASEIYVAVFGEEPPAAAR